MSTSIDVILLPMEEVNNQLKYVINRIKEIRKQKDISQLELSVRANLSLSFLASLEKGKKQPSVLTLLRIASALNVSPKIFFPENIDKTSAEIKEEIINLVSQL